MQVRAEISPYEALPDGAGDPAPGRDAAGASASRGSGLRTELLHHADRDHEVPRV
jgi:hypothetical protein